MNDDDKTPDPTPARLPPARLAEIRTIATAAPASLYAEPDPGATCSACEEHMAGEGAAILRTPGGGGALIVLSGDRDAEAVAFHREAREVVMELLAHLDALTPPAAPIDREAGGRLVREVWIAWAKEQPAPKPSWLVPWEGLSEPDKEVDRRIFEACCAAGRASLTPPAVPDGEAMGLAIFAASDMQAGESAESTAREWGHLLSGDRAEMIRQGTALHAIGYAAGRSEGEAERARATQEGIDIGRAQGWKEANVEIDRLVAARAGERASAAEAIEGQAAEPPDPRQLAVRISNDLRTLHAQLQAPENEHAATYLRPNMLAIVELTDRLTQLAAWRTSRS